MIIRTVIEHHENTGNYGGKLYVEALQRQFLWDVAKLLDQYRDKTRNIAYVWKQEHDVQNIIVTLDPNANRQSVIDDIRTLDTGDKDED